MPAAAEVCIIPGKLLSLGEDDADEFTVCPHPSLRIEADEAWSGGVDCVVPADFHLWNDREGYEE